MNLDFSVVAQYFPLLLDGLLVTVEVSAITLVLATVLGTFIAMARISHRQWLRVLAAIYVWIMRGTPVLLVLFFIYYAAPSFGLQLPAFAAAVIGMTLNSAAYKAEIIRSGIEAIPRTQTEAAFAVNMTYVQTMHRIVLPQAVRIVIPPYINNAILLVKNSALVSVITVPDLMLNAQQIVSSTYRAVEILGTAGLLYLVVTSLLMLAQRYSERRFALPDR
ncbi:amino acid ABC transporter permease [Amycolatopsis sp. NPDC050768]|uniref:amino acid ABC transporter permease n=1 Tax=Amycolatopsis sp. NPDC050768 TaxID=3154839 RepID=UPI0033FE1387